MEMETTSTPSEKLDKVHRHLLKTHKALEIQYERTTADFSDLAIKHAELLKEHELYDRRAE